MTAESGAQLVVERVDALASRPWIFVSGQLSGAPVAVGDEVTIRYGGRPDVAATVRAIELHSRAGTTTLALDGGLRDAVGPGAVLTTASQPG